ncbi:MFS transporter [Devriesea agamarum]|uniref:MFS transporter n=1 Tax=Devriesea agamarum TaxID=472569 RepID=UPI00071E417C|nr:MFS transporter [Devriesea agamarum]
MTGHTSANAAACRGGYGALPKLSGTAFFPIAWIARLPAAMMPVAVMTLLVATTGSYTTAGYGSGSVGLGTAIGAPLLGLAVDRFGQRRVLVPIAVLACLGILATVILAVYRAPTIAICAACLIAGLANPQVGVMARSRWLHLAGTPTHNPGKRAGWYSRTVAAALGYESMADELSFVVGPVLVGTVSALAGDPAPLTLAAAATALFVIWFALHRTAPPSVRMHADAGSSQAPARDIFRLPVLSPVIGMACQGAYFGATLTAVTAMANATGDPGRAGILYGAMGLTSAVFALTLVRVPDRISLRTRWIVSAAVMTVGALMLPLAHGPITLMLCLALTGCGVGPAMVTMFATAGATSPAGRASLVMTLMSAAVVTGQALASPLTGRLADHGGYAAVAWVPALCGLLVALAAIFTRSHRSSQ